MVSIYLQRSLCGIDFTSALVFGCSLFVPSVFVGWERNLCVGTANVIEEVSSLKEIMVPGRVHHALHVHRNSPALVTLAPYSTCVLNTLSFKGHIKVQWGRIFAVGGRVGYHVFFLTTTALVFTTRVACFGSYFSISGLLCFVLAFSLLPVIVVFVGPRSGFSGAIYNFTVTITIVFKTICKVCLHHPVKFIITFSRTITILCLVLASKPGHGRGL